MDKDYYYRILTTAEGEQAYAYTSTYNLSKDEVIQKLESSFDPRTMIIVKIIEPTKKWTIE